METTEHFGRSLKPQINWDKIEHEIIKHYCGGKKEHLTFTPSIAKTDWCKYKVNLKNNHSLIVIMTSQERNFVMRSRFAQYIVNIGGEGYMKPF